MTIKNPTIDLTDASTLALAAGHAARDAGEATGEAQIKLNELSQRFSELALQVLEGKRLPRLKDDESAGV
ncbi:hypothetical protein H8F21_22150 [Pseudomonas sp. P66]|uniref:Uncharacterized protein n=1 Tax=Pseudomonas arcuscaelestis TaxID=2710591 RepID=A0ABS2C3H4_9PSED|nr:hypothetical protein [Pseudomonas arcuscaelestis]MBM5460270.1 hypothetical protein [Pseudomonas arcuscaelestis]